MPPSPVLARLPSRCFAPNGPSTREVTVNSFQCICLSCFERLETLILVRGVMDHDGAFYSFSVGSEQAVDILSDSVEGVA